MPSHPHTKILLFLCLVGLTSFLATSIGLASDFWLIYSLGGNGTGDGNSTVVMVERVGVWRVCFRPDSLPADGKSCQNIDYLSKVETDNRLIHYIFPTVGYELLLAFVILVTVGVAIVFSAEAMAMVCLKIKVKTLYFATAVMFIIAGVLITAGLIVFTVRSDQLLSDWPVKELGLTPYDVLNFSWSFGITWAGAALALLNSCGYIWLMRVHMGAMM